jgi:hypothetical protein
MPAQIPNFVIGNAWTVVTITPQDVDADGKLTDNGTGAPILMQVRRVNMRSQNSTENLTAMGRRLANNVIYESATIFTLEYLIRGNDSAVRADTTNPPSLMAMLFDYAKLVVTRAGVTYTYYGIFDELEEEGVKERGTGTVTFAMVDPGLANPAVS